MDFWERCKCYVVTARNRQHESKAWIKQNQPGRVRVKDFVREHDLPIKQCHFTNHELKGRTLRLIGAEIHYDDKPCELRSAFENGIKAIESLTPSEINTNKEEYGHCKRNHSEDHSTHGG